MELFFDGVLLRVVLMAVFVFGCAFFVKKPENMRKAAVKPMPYLGTAYLIAHVVFGWNYFELTNIGVFGFVAYDYIAPAIKKLVKRDKKKEEKKPARKEIKVTKEVVQQIKDMRVNDKNAVTLTNLLKEMSNDTRN